MKADMKVMLVASD